MDLVRRQLEASTTSALEAQSRPCVHWRSHGSFFSYSRSTHQIPNVSTNCNPKEWSDYLTTTRPPQLHVRRYQ